MRADIRAMPFGCGKEGQQKAVLHQTELQVSDLGGYVRVRSRPLCVSPRALSLFRIPYLFMSRRHGVQSNAVTEPLTTVVFRK